MNAPIAVSRGHVISMLAVAVVGQASSLLMTHDYSVGRAVPLWATYIAWLAWVPWAGWFALLARTGWRRWLAGSCALVAAMITSYASFEALLTFDPRPKSHHAAVEQPFALHDTLTLSRLSDIDGNAFDLADYGDRPILLSVWRTWCGPCNKELGDLAALDGRSTAAGAIAVVGLSDEPRDLQREFRDDKGVKFRLVAHDENDPKLQVKRFPTNVVVRSGKVVDVWTGTIPNLAERVVAAAEGRPLPAAAPAPPSDAQTTARQRPR